MLDFLASVGRVFIGFLGATGRLTHFTLTALSHCVRPPFYPRLILRQMVDIGYYSSVHDDDIFRAESEKATGARKEQLQQHLDDLTVSFYRDPKRQNAEAINFNRVTCAQCHQTSARDGVHFSFNDDLNEKIKSKVYVTEFFFHDADEQLKTGMTYWTEAAQQPTSEEAH